MTDTIEAAPRARPTPPDVERAEADVGLVEPREPAATAGTRHEGRSRSGWLAVALALALAAWMGSGLVFPPEPEPEPERRTVAERAPVAVEVVASRARNVTDFLVSDGQAVPDRVTILRAEAGGNVETVPVSKGARVDQGQVLATIEAGDRVAQQASAEAELARARRDLEAVQSLFDRGYATRTRLDQARVAVTAAEAGVAQAARGQSDTTITAPFAGVLDAFDLEPGQVVSAGAEIGTLVDSDPLKIEIRVPQQAVTSISAGDAATVNFITGETREGRVTYVSTNANQATRTFTAEVEVEDTAGIPSGISAQVRIPTSRTKAHFVSPATLSLGADGRLGIKTAEADGTVGFYPVEVVRAETRGVWVSGLPDEARIITVGQGFVDKGETVAATERAVAATERVGQAEAEPAVAPAPATDRRTGGEAGPQPAPEGKPARAQGGQARPDRTRSSAPAPRSEPDVVRTTVGTVNGPAPTRADDAAGSDEVEVFDEAAGRPAGRKEPVPADPPVETSDEIARSTDNVRKVQESLNALGYDVGVADGIPGSRTVAGIRAFQRDLKLDTDGAITFDLLDALAQAIKERG